MTAPGAGVLQRLRAAGLGPTIARINVMQAIEAAQPNRISNEDVFRGLLARGTRTSLSTVYRVTQKLHLAGVLIRELDDKGKAHYRMREAGGDAQQLRLVCRRSGRTVVLADGGLHAGLLAAALAEGLDISGQDLVVEVERLAVLEPGDRRALRLVKRSA